MAQFASISPTALMRLIGTPNAPLVIDVCVEEDFAQDPFLIPTAERSPHQTIADLAPQLAGKRAVLVCQKGRKLSHGAAAVLRALNVRAEVLEGGNMTWSAAGLPRIPAPQRDTERWVTRWRPKIDRIACPWLIRRFVNPGAEFLFVPPAEVDAVAEKFEATAFDVPGARWTHEGALCTFDVMLNGWGLRTAALDKMSDVIRGADTGDHALAPECAGLLALSVGLSRGFGDDLEQLEAGMILYDALYRWARDGQRETHDSREQIA